MAASPSLQQTGQRIEILLQNIMEKKDKLLPNASQEDHPGNCRPWNKNDFIKRVATFKIGLFCGCWKMLSPCYFSYLVCEASRSLTIGVCKVS